MDPTKTCQTCKFFCAMANQCRIGRPLSIPVYQVPPHGGQPALAGFNGYWPPTAKENWCGEWASEDITFQRN